MPYAMQNCGKYGEDATRGYDIILKNAPWIFTENLEEFQKQLEQKGKKTQDSQFGGTDKV